MFLTATQDIYGAVERFSANDFRHILDLIDGYMKKRPYYVCEIHRDDIRDPRGRVDIEIEYVDDHGYPIRQKLLILDDEIVDGTMFHKKYSKLYKSEVQK